MIYWLGEAASVVNIVSILPQISSFNLQRQLGISKTSPTPLLWLIDELNTIRELLASIDAHSVQGFNDGQRCCHSATSKLHPMVENLEALVLYNTDKTPTGEK